MTRLCIHMILDQAPHTLVVLVRPCAPRSCLRKIMSDGVQKIDIAAPPEDGKANAELIRFLAEYFDVSRSSVEILSGQMGRRKMVRITSGSAGG